jgi:hypothetical protein
MIGVGLALGVAIAAACGGPKEANTSLPPSHWMAKVCTSDKDTLTIAAGPNQTDVESFATWRAGDGQASYGLPARVQQLEQVYVKMTGTPEGKSAQVCLRFDGRAKKAFNFTGHDEDHTVKAGDADDGSCRC